MGHAAEHLEHAEHVAHAGHGGDKLSRWVGITMAMLGVLLAFSAAKVGGQRTELTQALVDQQHAHAKSMAQDVKHRVAVLTLQQLHAEADPARTSAKDMVLIANTIERYLGEAQLAEKWMDSYDPLIEAHAKSQEEYEHAQLAAEFGIVLASIALLLKKRAPWLIAVGLGATSIVLIAITYMHAHGVIHDAEANIVKLEKDFEELRVHNKTDKADQALVDDVRKTYQPLVDKAPK